MKIKLLPVFIALASMLNLAWAEQDKKSPKAFSYNLSAQVEGLPSSWALAVSPDNIIWLTHRSGGFSKISATSEPSGENKYIVQTIEFNPSDLLTGGQGGLLDIIFHPEYSNNGWIYLSYSAGTSSANALKIVRFKLVNDAVTDVQHVFEVANKKDTPVHYGGRMAFSANNALLVTSGDGFDYREQAQIKDNQLGKVLRMTDTGAAYPANPYVNEGNENAAYVLSLGHRNPQGLLVTPEQTIIAHEHGPAGGDEINMIEPGLNYGWPVISNGDDYSGARISPFREYQGMQQPKVDWTPSIAPSGMLLYSQEQFSELQKHLLVTSLKYKQIYAVPFDQGRFGKDFVLLEEALVRLRDIETDINGAVWVLGDGEPATLYKLQRK